MERLTDNQRALVEENLELAYFLARVRRPPIGMDQDDWNQEVFESLCLAVQIHNPEKGTLATLTRSLVMAKKTEVRRAIDRRKLEVLNSDISGDEEEIPVGSCHPDISADSVEEIEIVSEIFPEITGIAAKGYFDDGDLQVLNKIRSWFGYPGKAGVCKRCSGPIIRDAACRAKTMCTECRIEKDREDRIADSGRRWAEKRSRLAMSNKD